MQRYTWEDALIEAQAVGKIKNRELLAALKLARAIKWDAEFSELRWSNEVAAEAVGIPRATFYRAIKVLKREGYLTVVKGNLIPVIPESQSETKTAYELHVEATKSQFDTKKSQFDTTKSQSDTTKSQFDNPYSEDTYTVDTSSGDSSSTPAGAGVIQEESLLDIHDLEWDIQPSLMEVKRNEKSQFETEQDDWSTARHYAPAETMAW